MSFFVYVFVYANKFYAGNPEEFYVSVQFTQGEEKYFDGINIASVSIDTDSNSEDGGIIKYTVQPGDTLGEIARTFGTTTTQIKKVNNIQNTPIRPGQRLIISNENDGFIYNIKEKTNVLVFANKYSLNIEDLMTLNYIQDESEMLDAGQDIFINVTKEKAYDVGLLERPKPVIKPIITSNYKPTINKVSNTKKNTSQTRNSTRTTSSEVDETPSRGGGNYDSEIISQWVFKKNIKNSFYAGYCTWYAAVITPEIFKYTSENTQERVFGGNARERCANAKNA